MRIQQLPSQNFYGIQSYYRPAANTLAFRGEAEDKFENQSAQNENTLTPKEAELRILEQNHRNKEKKQLSSKMADQFINRAESGMTQQEIKDFVSEYSTLGFISKSDVQAMLEILLKHMYTDKTSIKNQKTQLKQQQEELNELERKIREETRGNEQENIRQEELQKLADRVKALDEREVNLNKMADNINDSAHFEEYIKLRNKVAEDLAEIDNYDYYADTTNLYVGGVRRVLVDAMIDIINSMKLPDGRQLLHANRETIMVTPGFRRERISVNYEAPNGYIYSQRSDTGFNIIPPSKK